MFTQVSLVVNVASHSEHTELNYRALQDLHKELGTSHFNVLAFPCGQYGETEPGNSYDIESFAKTTYGVTFPFFSKIKILGSDPNPAFKFITGKLYSRAKESVHLDGDVEGGGVPKCHTWSFQILTLSFYPNIQILSKKYLGGTSGNFS